MAMVLSEEEQYRMQVKEKYKQELGKKGMPKWLKIGLLILGLIFVFNALSTIIALVKDSGKSNPTTTVTPSPTSFQSQPITPEVEEDTQVQQVVNVRELIGKRYADLESILGTPELEYKPEPPATGLIAWEKGDVNIETNYYNLQDSVQAISFSFKEGVSFKDHNDAFKTVGLDAINSQPDKTTTFQKKWYNIQGIYSVSFTTGINGRQAILVLFYCNPDRLGVCKLLK